MTNERAVSIAEQLEDKANAVLDGFYGEDFDNESWAANLRRAAARLRAGLFDELTDTDLEEIECGSDADATEMLSLLESENDNEAK
jgi:hypothetical protein